MPATKTGQPIRAAMTSRKFAFVGSVCVGKTTLLDACRKRWGHDPQIAFVDEVARRFFSEHTEVVHLRTATQARLVRMIIEEETRAAASSARIVFCDRAVTDAVPYAEVAGDLAGAAALAETIAPWIPTYELFFVLDPRDVPYVDDGVRSESVALRAQIHEACVAYLSQSGLPYQILSGTIDDRLRSVRRAVWPS